MKQSNSRYRQVTKAELIDVCLTGPRSYVINGKPSDDVQLVKEILFNKQGAYRFSVSVEEPDRDGVRLVSINYEVVDRANR